MSHRNAKLARRFAVVCGDMAGVSEREAKDQLAALPADVKARARHALETDIAQTGELAVLNEERRRQTDLFTRPPLPLNALVGLPPPIEPTYRAIKRHAAKIDAPRLYPERGEWLRDQLRAVSPKVRARVEAWREAIRGRFIIPPGTIVAPWGVPIEAIGGAPE